MEQLLAVHHLPMTEPTILIGISFLMLTGVCRRKPLGGAVRSSSGLNAHPILYLTLKA